MSPSNTLLTGTASNSRRRPALPKARTRAARRTGHCSQEWQGCCTSAGFLGGGGAPFQNFRKDVDLFQVGASILHVPSGLFVYGLYQHEENKGRTQRLTTFCQASGLDAFNNQFGSDANDTDVWFAKAGIKRAWSPAGATVIWGEGGQYLDQFAGLAGVDLCQEVGNISTAFPPALHHLATGASASNNAQRFSDELYG